VTAFIHPRRSGLLPSLEPARGEPAASPSLDPLEIALVAVTAAHLCFLPWALGSMHRWSQLVSLGFALTGFVLSLCSRAGGDGVFLPASRLRRFPVFWAGLAMLLYIAIQGLNPAWSYARNADSWWLVPVAHLAWLPSGVQAPFAQSNPWSALVVFGSLWLLVCSVWVGLTRRRSYRLLFTALVANGFLLALLGVLQQLTDTKRIFWAYLPSNGSFIASFIYRNHAGPYLNLMVALAVGLGFWHYQRSQRQLEKLNSAVIISFLAVFVSIMVVFSYSRASIGVLLAFTLFIACSLVARRYFERAHSSRYRTNLFILIAVFTGFLGICLVSLRAERVWQRFAMIATEPAGSIGIRNVAREASNEMLRDHWMLGWGAGCFRYGFPLYAQKHPEIYHSSSGKLMFWEHAHDDLLEFPIEFGVVGLIPPIYALGCAAWQLSRRRFWRNGVSLPLVLVCTLLVGHSFVDFVFQNPAILLTWSVLLVAAVRWLELDQPGTHRLVARARPDSSLDAGTKKPAGSLQNQAGFVMTPPAGSFQRS
jgi:hypothetical protein